MKSKRKKKEPVVINKEETAESWCFVCKDGGDLRICDYKDCQKSYHPNCVGKDDSFLESEDNWACDWHTCSICRGKCSYIHCYTCCKNSVCRRCLRYAEFRRIKGQYGFCTDCLQLALLIEEGKDRDSDGVPVDFSDRDTTEGLFKEYYMIIKEEEGFESGDLYAANDGVKKKKKTEYSSEEYGEEQDQSDFDGDDRGKCRKRSNGKRSGRKNSVMRTPMESRKNYFIGWGSRSLIEFLNSIGKSTDAKLHEHDVTSIVNAYVKEKKLLHPEKRKTIVCDPLLQSLFGKKTISKNRVHELLEGHFVENYDDSEEDEAQYDSQDDNACIPDVCKRQKKLNVERKLSEGDVADNVPVGCFASIVVENVKLVYLRRTMLLELLKQSESFADKVVGCFVRIKSDPYDYCSRHSHQLMLVRGIRRVSIGQTNLEAILLISGMPEEISTSQLSDGVFSKEECEDLRRRVLAGQLKRPRVVSATISSVNTSTALALAGDLQQKANALHVNLTKHWIIKELALLQNLIDQANEKGWRREFAEYLEKKRKLQTPSEVSKLLENVPKVIPDLDEFHPNPEDIENGMSSEKDTPKSILRCYSSISNDRWQDGKESEEKTHDRDASPLVRKQLIFEGPNSEAVDGNITCRKRLQPPTAELKNNKPKGEELEVCSQETPHEQRTSTVEVLSDNANSNETKVTATVDGDQNMDDSENSLWCLKPPNGEPKKFRLSTLRTWSQTNPYASKFKVWKEGEIESNAVWLKDVFSKK